DGRRRTGGLRAAAARVRADRAGTRRAGTRRAGTRRAGTRRARARRNANRNRAASGSHLGCTAMSKPICVSRLLTCVGLVVLTGFGLTGCPGDEVPVEDETGGTELLPGALVITEVAANAPGADGGKEWFELHNASGESVDLQGLVLIYEKADGSGHKEHTIARSVEVPAGGHVVVGGILDDLAGSTAHVDYGYGAELGEFGNSAGYLAIGG